MMTTVCSQTSMTALCFVVNFTSLSAVAMVTRALPPIIKHLTGTSITTRRAGTTFNTNLTKLYHNNYYNFSRYLIIFNLIIDYKMPTTKLTTHFNVCQHFKILICGWFLKTVIYLTIWHTLWRSKSIRTITWFGTLLRCTVKRFAGTVDKINIFNLKVLFQYHFHEMNEMYERSIHQSSKHHVILFIYLLGLLKQN